jgi:hypothetical protein
MLMMFYACKGTNYFDMPMGIFPLFTGIFPTEMPDKRMRLSGRILLLFLEWISTKIRPTLSSLLSITQYFSRMRVDECTVMGEATLPFF